MALKLRKGDTVIVRSGSSKGAVGRILQVLPDKKRVIVEGVNMVVRHTKPSQKNPEGGRLRQETSIHVSNVAHVDPEKNLATRVGVKFLDTGDKVLVSKKSGKVLRSVATQ